MNSNSKQLCRVCVKKSDDIINIFNQFQDATIASILVEHFWFQVRKNDGMTEWLCKTCWKIIKTFHIFYNRIEFLHAEYYSSTDLDSGNLKTKEQSVSPREEVLEFDLNIVKCEETVVNVPSIGEKSSNCDDNNDCDDGENSPNLGDEYQSSNKKSKNNAVRDINAGKQTPTANSKPENGNTHRRSERDKENAQIRQFFNMKCKICNDVEFDSLLRAKQHYRKVHNTEGYIVCCEKKFYRRHMILNHIVFHVNPGAYRCDQCDRCFKNKYSLRYHIGNHVPLDSRALRCQLCSSSFTHAGRLKAHVESTHSSKTGEMFPCDKCSKKFRSRLLLKYHYRSIHEPTVQKICEICARQFKTRTSLQHHIDRQHSTTPIPKLQCNICGARYLSKLGYNSHMKNQHFPTQDDSVNCSICNKVFNNKHLLRRHINYVHGEKNHQCTLCDKAFRTGKTLKEHVASHTGEDLYDCLFCEKKFKSNANMYSHQKKAHLVEWTQYKEKKRME